MIDCSLQSPYLSSHEFLCCSKLYQSFTHYDHDIRNFFIPPFHKIIRDTASASIFATQQLTLIFNRDKRRLDPYVIDVLDG